MRWPKACLGDVAQVVSGATPKSSVDHYWDGVIPWITPADLSNLAYKEVSVTTRRITAAGLSSCSARLLPARSVLFSSRAPVCHVAMTTVPMATNQGFKSFVPDHEILSPDFLYWWLKSNKSYLQSLGRGATFKEVSKEIVESIEIPLPPLEEQRRIAAILDKASTIKQKSATASALAESLCIARLEQLVATNETLLVGRRLEDLCILGAPITYGILQPGPDLDGGIPYVRPSEIKNSRIDIKSLKRTSPEIAAKYRKSELQEGDILFTIVGTIGEAAVVPAELEGANITQSSARIRIDTAQADPAYVYYSLKSQHASRQISRDRLGVAVERLNLHHVRDMEILCLPMEIQNAYAKEVHCMMQLTSRHSLTARHISSLIQSLTSSLLASGERQ